MALVLESTHSLRSTTFWGRSGLSHEDIFSLSLSFFTRQLRRCKPHSKNALLLLSRRPFLRLPSQEQNSDRTRKDKEESEKETKEGRRSREKKTPQLRNGEENMCIQVDKRWKCGHIGFFTVKWCPSVGKGCKGTAAEHEVVKVGEKCGDCEARRGRGILTRTAGGGWEASREGM